MIKILCRTSVADLAEISLRSPWKLCIFIIKIYIYRIKVSKNNLFHFEKTSLCRTPWRRSQGKADHTLHSMTNVEPIGQTVHTTSGWQTQASQASLETGTTPVIHLLPTLPKLNAQRCVPPLGHRTRLKKISCTRDPRSTLLQMARLRTRHATPRDLPGNRQRGIEGRNDEVWQRNCTSESTPRWEANTLIFNCNSSPERDSYQNVSRATQANVTQVIASMLQLLVLRALRTTGSRHVYVHSVAESFIISYQLVPSIVLVNSELTCVNLRGEWLLSDMSMSVAARRLGSGPMSPCINCNDV